MKNVFYKGDCDEFVKRINLLQPDSKGLWGKMDVAQMLAHCNVSYEMVYDDIHPKPGFFLKIEREELIFVEHGFFFALNPVDHHMILNY